MAKGRLCWMASGYNSMKEGGSLMITKCCAITNVSSEFDEAVWHIACWNDLPLVAELASTWAPHSYRERFSNDRNLCEELLPAALGLPSHSIKQKMPLVAGASVVLTGRQINQEAFDLFWEAH